MARFKQSGTRAARGVKRAHDPEKIARANAILGAAAAKKPKRPAPTLPSDALVVTDRVSKVYVPSPPWMKVLLRSSIRFPVVALED